MSIRSVASGASLWRGYEYYQEGNVLSCVQTGADEYEGRVAGTAPEPYRVKINLAHVYQSTCDCPHADGKRRVCKHMVALYFAALPAEAKQYISDVEAYEREEELRQAEHYRGLQSYVKSLSKKELQEELFQALVELEERGRRYF